MLHAKIKVTCYMLHAHYKRQPALDHITDVKGTPQEEPRYADDSWIEPDAQIHNNKHMRRAAHTE